MTAWQNANFGNFVIIVANLNNATRLVLRRYPRSVWIIVTQHSKKDMQKWRARAGKDLNPGSTHILCIEIVSWIRIRHRETECSWFQAEAWLPVLRLLELAYGSTKRSREKRNLEEPSRNGYAKRERRNTLIHFSLPIHIYTHARGYAHSCTFIYRSNNNRTQVERKKEREGYTCW